MLAGLIFCLSICLAKPSFVKAGNDNDAPLTTKEIEEAVRKYFPMLFEAVKEAPATYQIEKDDLIDNKLLAPIRVITPMYSLEQLLNGMEIHVLHIPVVNAQGDIKLIFSVIKTDGSINCSLGPDFANALNQLKEEGVDRAVVLQDKNGIQILDQHDTKISDCIGTESITRYEQERFLRGPYISLDLFQVDEHLTEIARDSLREIEVVPTNQSGTVTKQSRMATNQQATDSSGYSLRVSSPIKGRQTTAYPLNKYLNSYPIVHQRVDGIQRGLCWAATVASMVRFEKPTHYGNLTAKQVADYMGIGYDAGGTNTQARNALSHYLGSPYLPTIMGVLSSNEIRIVINNIDPAYLQCRRKAGFWPWSYDYHATAMTGYDFRLGLTVQIMDPAYECFKSCTSDGESWTFAFADTRFTWQRTICLLYRA